jgi:light-regulated signal transduction histidine kinase (bacteriophytochrome)
MNDLIDDLLAYAREGTNNEPKVPIPLDREVETAISELAAAIQETGARITHDPLPAVTARQSQLTRLFLNLIGNAIKYRDPTRQPHIHISAALDAGDYVTIAIGDNGLGFESEYADQIFEPFTRLHGKEYKGSGVGLAICRRIVSDYGGSIWAESSPGKGSTFFFTLPRGDR